MACARTRLLFPLSRAGNRREVKNVQNEARETGNDAARAVCLVAPGFTLFTVLWKEQEEF